MSDAATVQPLDDRCPRCGGAFHCGVNGAAPCPCTTVTLSAELQGRLRERFKGCLCVSCLVALAGGAGLEAESSQG